MTELITWLMISYGMTQILVYGKIFEGTRDSITKWGDNDTAPFNWFGSFLSAILSCMMCCGTWVGFFMSFFYSPSNIFLNIDPIFSIFFDGMLASGGVWAINSIIEWFEENRNGTETKSE